MSTPANPLFGLTQDPASNPILNALIRFNEGLRQQKQEQQAEEDRKIALERLAEQDKRAAEKFKLEKEKFDLDKERTSLDMQQIEQAMRQGEIQERILTSQARENLELQAGQRRFGSPDRVEDSLNSMFGPEIGIDPFVFAENPVSGQEEVINLENATAFLENKLQSENFGSVLAQQTQLQGMVARAQQEQANRKARIDEKQLDHDREQSNIRLREGLRSSGGIARERAKFELEQQQNSLFGQGIYTGPEIKEAETLGDVDSIVRSLNSPAFEGLLLYELDRDEIINDKNRNETLRVLKERGLKLPTRSVEDFNELVNTVSQGRQIVDIMDMLINKTARFERGILQGPTGFVNELYQELVGKDAATVEKALKSAAEGVRDSLGGKGIPSNFDIENLMGGFPAQKRAIENNILLRNIFADRFNENIDAFFTGIPDEQKLWTLKKRGISLIPRLTEDQPLGAIKTKKSFDELNARFDGGAF